MIIVLCIILWIKSCWIGNFLYHSFFNRCIWQDIKWFKISTGLSFAEIQSYLRIIKGPPLFHIPSVQHISSTQKGHFFSAPKTPQFHTPVSSTLKTLQFNTPLRQKIAEVCWTEGFLEMNWGIFGVEKVWSLCGTDVLN